jgi:tetratricopeptide (TPR) repeat protein
VVEVNNSIGSKIKGLRKHHGLTQAQLGKGFLSVTYISRIEKGYMKLPEMYQEEMAKRLGVSVKHLLEEEDDSKVEQIKNWIFKALQLAYQGHINESETMAGEIQLDIERYLPDNEYLKLDINVLLFFLCLSNHSTDNADQYRSKILTYPIGLYPNLLYRFLRYSGNLFYKKGMFLESLKCYIEALEIDIDKIDMQIDYSLLIYNLSLTYLQLGDILKSHYYIKNAIEEFDKLGCWSNISEAYIILGNIWEKQGKYENAISTYKKVLSLGEQTDNPRLESMALHNLGIANFRLNNLEKAHEYLEKALFIKKRFSNEKDISITLYSLAKSFYKQSMNERFSYFIKLLDETLKKNTLPIY